MLFARQIIIYAWRYFPSVRSGLVQLLVNFVQYAWLVYITDTPLSPEV